MQGIDFVFSIAILIMSVVAHEVAHGYAAYMLGDKTAQYAGRLTLNPVKHLDPIGSFLVPLISYTFGGLIFGWAKPVPYNPYNLPSKKWAEPFVASAGILANLLIALVFGLILRFGVGSFLPETFVQLTITLVAINLVLAVFNSVPIPPLDGSKILFAFLPPFHSVRQFLEQNGFFIVLFFIFFLWRFIIPVVGFLFFLITGISIF
ncbi:MAG: site-2 protease family protein [Candidatus Pacebacteria bacterium]|nr:site-2 protease family protein [Candidatus Paceibacterota bacterium]